MQWNHRLLICLPIAAAVVYFYAGTRQTVSPSVSSLSTESSSNVGAPSSASAAHVDEAAHRQLVQKAKDLLERRRQKLAAYAAYHQAETAFDRTYAEVQQLRHEALAGARTPTDFAKLDAQQLAKVEHANDLESAAHERLLQAFKQLKGG